MHFSQARHDPLAHLSDLPYYGSPLGQYAEAAMMAYDLYKDQEAGSGDTTGTSTPGGTGMPGDEPSVPRQPSSVATVSASFQTQISPQISPVMTQMQASPGATVGASPMQYMPGGMSAEAGISPYGNFAAPGMPGTTPGISPMQPYTMDPMTGGYLPVQPGDYYSRTQAGGAGSPISVGGSTMQDLPWIPIALVAGGLGLVWFMTQKKTRARPR